MREMPNVCVAVENIDMLDYFNKYVASLERGVQELSDSTPATLCPFHNETDPSFHQYIDRRSRLTPKDGVTLRRYKCFGCGISGNVVDLFIKTEFKKAGKTYLSKEEAAIALLRLYGLENLIVKQGSTDVFGKALRKIRGYNKIELNPVMNISKFSQLNFQILGSDEPMDIKVKKFGEIDKMACAVCMIEGDGNKGGVK